jgi:GNAT superfamily N-acetyltransferase
VDLLERFYREVYLLEFAAQREPLEAWRRALAGDAPYRLTIDVDPELRGGIAYELYPRSMCGLVTYMVVAPGARNQGLGRRWLDTAVATLRAAGARAVFGEVSGAERIARFQRWGAKVVDARYIQPALGDGLERDRELVLIALAEQRTELPGALVRAFVEELYAATEGGAPDPAISIPETVALVTW